MVFRLVGLLVLATLSTSPVMAAPLLINGAGSTFAAPLYARWIAEFKTVDASAEINYQAIGSSGGIRQFVAGTTDFGASDDPMKADEIKQVKGRVLHIPTALGAVVMTYNIPGITGAIKLTPELIADIYLGKVEKWDDAKIKALNPGINFPKQVIVAAWRADGSGTTSVFTEYLAGHSPEFKTKVGQGKSVKFPVGLGGKGNDGVTGIVRQNPGALGYVELTFAKTNNLPMAAIRNKNGKFVEPKVESVLAAAASTKMPRPREDLKFSLLNATGDSTYPIASPTYILVNKDMDKAKGAKLEAFLTWALGAAGQAKAAELHYAGLPKAVKTRALDSIKGLGK